MAQYFAQLESKQSDYTIVIKKKLKFISFIICYIFAYYQIQPYEPFLCVEFTSGNAFKLASTKRSASMFGFEPKPQRELKITQ